MPPEEYKERANIILEKAHLNICTYIISMYVETFLNPASITHKSDCVECVINKPTKEMTVLQNDKPWEGISNGYYTIIYTGKKYLMYYRACIGNINKHLVGKQYLALATSNDGLHFEKPNFEIVAFGENSNNNLILHNDSCHNFFPFYDVEKDLFLGIGGTYNDEGGVYFYTSTNGIIWERSHRIFNDSMILHDNLTHDNHFDSHNVMLFDKPTNSYVFYLRDNSFKYRLVQRLSSSDLANFSAPQRINVNERYIYTNGILNYPKSNELIGFSTFLKAIDGKDPNIAPKENLVKTVNLIHSIDGLNFAILSSPLLDLSVSTFSVYGLVPSVDKKKFYIYTQDEQTKDIVCDSYRRDGLHSIVCKSLLGSFTTRVYDLSGDELTVNANVRRMYIEVYDEGENYLTNSREISGDHLDYKVVWNKPFGSGKYYFKFYIDNGTVYSISAYFR